MFKQHPEGLPVLFFTEMWERFSYYGMRALLILFMTASVATGGMGFDVAKAAAIYGLYTAMAFMMGMPGGWIADKIIGQRNAVFYGGILISIGNLLLVFPSEISFYIGLVTVILGTGLLKPNVSAMVGQLYAEGDSRRDAGFSLFYMGINIGAFASPLICGYIGETIEWRYGFIPASVGMVFGLIQYKLGGSKIGTAGLLPSTHGDPAAISAHVTSLKKGIAYSFGLFAVVMALQLSGIISITPTGLSAVVGYVGAVAAVIFFIWLLTNKEWSLIERQRLAVISILFLCAALFWSAFEQAGSTLNLFADQSTDRVMFGWEMPTTWFQSFNSFFIFLLAPVFAVLWVKLGKREPSSPAKFAFGLVFVGLGFLVMVIAATLSANGEKVSPLWLTLVYFLHTIGELTLSPVGLSTVTKLSPTRVVGLMMGVWFLGSAVGNYIGGNLAGLYESLPLPTLFGIVFVFSSGLGLLLFLFVKPIRKMMHGVH